MNKLLFFVFTIFSLTAFAKKPQHTYVSIRTAKGECIVMLYNETPKHRDNFIKLAEQGTYNGTLFHRVIKDFMIQGGDVDSKYAKPGQALGNGDLGYKVDAEFRDSLFHKKGVLAAARDGNPQKASSSCQFYLAQGRVFTDQELDKVEQTRLQGRKIPVWQREIYKTIGGIPHLDQNYTVYGEVVKGIAMIDSIAAEPTDANNRPLTDISMQVTVLKKKEARKLEKELVKDAFKAKLIMNPKM